MNVDFDVRGAGLAADRLRRIADQSIDMRTPFRAIRELIIQGHAQQFATQGAFLGTPWPPLAPGTLAHHVRHGQPARPLERTGALRTSLEGGKGRRTRASRSVLSVGTSLFYAVFHIKGSKGKRTNVPARPPVGMNDAQRETALTIMERYLSEAAR